MSVPVVALASTVSLTALPALAASIPLFPLLSPASPPSTAPVPWRTFSRLLRLRLRIIPFSGGVVGYGYRAFIRQQPDFDLGRFAAESQDS